MKTLQFVDDVIFQTYHALYSPENIFLHNETFSKYKANF